jgi:Exostosin family
MNILIFSCSGTNSESIYCAELGRLAGLCTTETITLVPTPEEADIILIVDIHEGNLNAGLRRNKVWQKWPEKSFAYLEGAEPTRFLHGLYSSPRKSWSGSGRFQACAYPLFQLFHPNPCPSPPELAAVPKDLLFSFAGRVSHRVRKRLFSLAFPCDEVVLVNTSDYNHFCGGKVDRKEARTRFWNLARRSKYGLCPRGAGTSSIRLFEMMEAGIAPIILADDWLPPRGPKWEDFALFVPERKVGSLYKIAKNHEPEYVQRGRLARQAWEQFFSPEKYWSFILESVRHIQRHQKFSESIYVKLLPLMVAQEWFRRRRIHAVIGLKIGIKAVISKLVRDGKWERWKTK